MAGAAACHAQGLQAGPGLWLFTRQCQETAGSDTTYLEGHDQHQTTSAQTGVQLPQVPITDADLGVCPACLVIRIAHVKLQTRHSPNTGDRRHFMTKTSMFC